MLEKWQHFFGEQMKIVIYDNLKSNQEDPLFFLLEKCLRIKTNDCKVILPQSTINGSYSIEKVELIRQFNIEYGWKTTNKINIDELYETLLRKGKVFRKNYTFASIAGKNAKSLIELQNSVSGEILNHFRDCILNPHNHKELYVNQNSLPNFECLPNGFFQRYLYLEAHRKKLNKWKTELRNFEKAWS